MTEYPGDGNVEDKEEEDLIISDETPAVPEPGPLVGKSINTKPKVDPFVVIDPETPPLPVKVSNEALKKFRENPLPPRKDLD